MAKQKFRITNWSTYNKALINRGSLTFWLDDEAIQAWYESATPSSRGRPQRYSDLAITTVLVIKRVFRLTLRAAQGFIDSIFALMNVPLRCPDYTSVSKRAKPVNVSFKTSTRGEIAHLVIDSTGLKVFGEGEWKVKKHGQERRRIWRKLHLAVDSNTHEIICADLSLNNVTDSEAFPGLIRQTHRKIRAASADGAYDTRLCHAFGDAVPRGGNAGGGGQPGWILKCKGWETDPNAYIYFTIQEQNWENTCKAIGKPEWITDPAYSTAHARQPHIFDIFAEIEKYTVTIDKHEAVAYLTQFDIPCAPVLSMKEISLDPSLRQSGSVVEVEQPLRGKYLTVGCPMKFSAFTPDIKAAPLLGEHTAAVLQELGYSDDEIAAMKQNHAI